MLHRQQNRAPLSRRGWSAVALVALGVGIPLAAAGVAPAEQPAVVLSEARDVALPGGASATDTSREAREVPAARPPAPAPVLAAPARTSEAAVLRQATATIAGRVLDPSGGTMPGVQLTLTNPQTGTQSTLPSDADGRFAFRDLQPARYELVARLPGFATVSNLLTLQSGAALQRTITMPLGTVQESITLVCSATPAANAAHHGRPNPSLPAAALSGAARLQQFVLRSINGSVFPVLSAQEPAAVEPIRVGGNVRAPRKLIDVKPICPPTVPPTETAVRLTGRLGVDGFIHDVTPVPAEPGAQPPMPLIESAMDAIRQWTFTPTLLNGQPVDVNVSVLVVFKRS